MASNDRLTKAQRREAARRKAAELRAKQEREQRRNKIIGIALLVVTVVAIGGGIFAVVKQRADVSANKDKYSTALFPTASPAPAPADVPRPSTADLDRVGIPISSQGVGTAATGGVTVDVYLDFMCPYCGKFEREQADEISKVLTQDDVTVVYHPVAIMDGASKGTSYSTRAANAASVVADKDPTHFLAFAVALMAQGTQPQEGTSGLSDEKLAQVAQGVGVPASVTDQFTATTDYQGTTLRTFVPWTVAVTSTLPTNADLGRSGQPDSSSTPTIVIDGKEWTDWANDGKLSDAVAAARAATAGGTSGGQG